MRTIILTYPGYQSLPRGIKQMLVASENFYFDEIGTVAASANRNQPKAAKTAQFNGVTSLGGPLQMYARA
ncbi:MAG TPA: hypothetical protein VKU37_15000 [Verrucomicrobiae bacterium]|nr:hypothetical protein [Verrucomicrobiae bacterium]